MVRYSLDPSFIQDFVEPVVYSLEEPGLEKRGLL